jgi:formylglycine-generating enzyme required for sulfatase activity
VATSPNNLTLYRYKCVNKSYTEQLGDGVGLTLMLIPPGKFLMGAPEDEPDSDDSEGPQHWVTMAQFLMGCTPVTQAQWRVVAGYEPVDMKLDADPSYFKGEDLPVESVSWEAATEFCKRLSAKFQRNYRLPSEAQWEYACRAGTETAYHYGPKITPELANYKRAVGQTTEVGKYPSNHWGLFDMHGNVDEWCEDIWHENYEGFPTDGRAWLEGGDSSRPVLRGGSWYYIPGYCRSACRYYHAPDVIDLSLGFRVVCAAPRTS